jgi:hypothetical protein
MKRTSIVAFLVAITLAAASHVILDAQDRVGQNINVVSGSADQFIGDMFRQRQNEPAGGISSVNPSHMMLAYNDYRTVDLANDSGVGTTSPAQTAIAKVFNLLRAPWRRERERTREAGEEADSAQAWIGLSFTDNGKDWYTGLLPGHQNFLGYPSPPEPGGTGLGGRYEAASDPVMATTADRFFLGGIAFNPNGESAGFVSRFTDRNDTSNGQNIQHDWTKVLVTQPQNFFVDKPSIAAGPNGHVYAAFVVFDQADPKKLSSTILFFQSADYGDTWSSGAVISQPLTRNQSPWIAVDPNDEQIVYIGWRVFANPLYPNLTNAVVGRKSTNGGQSFTPSVPYPVALLLKPFDVPQVKLALSALQIPRSNAYPTAAIDGNGGIHVAMQEYVYPFDYPIAGLRGLALWPLASPLTGVPRITVTSSYDGGATWTLRRAVDAGPGSGTQFMPALTAVGEPGPSCAGQPGPPSRIMLMYYDARAGGVGTVAGTNGGIAGGDKQFDVRIAQASACNLDALGRPIFSPSVQLSRYSLSATPPHGVVTVSSSLPNPPITRPAVNRAYSMFCGGNCAFTGDYVFLSPRVPYVHTATGWKPTTARSVDRNKLPAPTVQGAWADTRDVQLPQTGPLRTAVPPYASPIDLLPWDVYNPPGTGLVSCTNPGARDQNVYTAEYAPGELFAGVPDTFQTSNIPRSYPLFVENRSGELRLFRLMIDPSVLASFRFADFAGAPVSIPAAHQTADIVIRPYSSVTGAVIIGPGEAREVTITVQQLAATRNAQGLLTSNGDVLPNGARTAVTLHPGGSGPTTDSRTPVVAQTPVVTYPFAGRVPFTVPAGTPFSETPFAHQTSELNPFSETPFSETPFPTDVTVFDVVDVSFNVTIAGSDAAAVRALLAARAELNTKGNYLFQVIINRLSSAPALNGCNAFDRRRDNQISNIVRPFATPFSETPFSETPFSETVSPTSPFSETPFSETPFSETTNPRDPEVSNSTFYIAPPGTSAPTYRAPRPVDEVVYTLRAYQLRASTDPALVPLIRNNQAQVGIIVKSETPPIILIDGQPRFDPAGAPAVGGGAAVPVKLGFTAPIPASAPGRALGGEGGVSVAIQDGFGNTVPGSTAPVTIALGSNPGNATLSGTLTLAAVNGVATFRDLSIDRAGSGYTLVASSRSLQPATSAAFDVQPVIVGNTAAFGSGPIVTFAFPSGSTVGSFTPTGALGNNPRGVAVLGNELYYTALSGDFGATDAIHVAPFNGGAGGADTRTLPNPRPDVGISDLSFSGGVLYALTGYGAAAGAPVQVFGLNPLTGAVVSGPVTIAGPATPDFIDADGFAVLPNGRFLINNADASCTYNQYDPTTGAIVPATTIVVPGGVESAVPFSGCTGVDTDGASLFFVTNFNAITKTDLAGTLIATMPMAYQFLEDIAIPK